jgi:Ca2+-binding EF-hand superfamily protein
LITGSPAEKKRIISFLAEPDAPDEAAPMGVDEDELAFSKMPTENTAPLPGRLRNSRTSFMAVSGQSQIFDEIHDGTQSWESMKMRKKIGIHLTTSVSDRLDRVDARRRLCPIQRQKAMERKIERQKEAKKQKYEALPEKEREHISDAFQKFDLDNSGELDKDEVVQCLKEFGLSGINGEETAAIVDICGAVSTDVAPMKTIKSMAELAEQEEEENVAVDLYDLAITVIPKVRRKLQEMRSQTLLRHFRMFDHDQKGSISMVDCHKLSEELGIDAGIFEECFRAKTPEEEEGEEDQVQVGRPIDISFDSFQSVVFAAKEKSTRESRQKERQIQIKEKLAEEVFQEFREDMLVLHELFGRYDTESKGYLEMMEAIFMIKDFGLLSKDPKERDNIMGIVESSDEDGSGEFSFDEFLGLVHNIRSYNMELCKDEMQFIFERYDRDGSGELSIAELSGLLCQLGLVPHTRREQEELAQLIHLIDGDGSGLIDFEEFQALCQRIKENMSRLRYETEIDKVRKKGFTDEEIHNIRFAFDRLDTTMNGHIDKNETKICIEMTELQVTIDAFEEAYCLLDSDNNGELDLVEFSELMRLLRDREGLFQKEENGLSRWSENGL